MASENNSKQRFGRLFFLLSLLLSLQNTAFAQCTTRPAASLQVANNDVCSDEPVSITNGTNEHGNRLMYIWNWGDGKKDTLFNKTTPQHLFTWNSCDTSTKDFTVRLDVISVEPACSNSLFNHVATTQVSVSKKPAAGFTPSRSEVCTDNGLVNFRNTSCPKTVLGLTYLWNFGDPASGAANTSNALDPSHNYTVSGNYTVTLTVNGRICNTPSVATRTIVVRDPAVANATYSGTACAPASFKFTNESVGDVTSTWSVSPSTGVGFSPSANDRNPTISFARTGSYVVTLQITNPCGSKTWKSQAINIVARPSATAIARVPNLCAGGSATPILSSSNEGGAPTTYNWTFEGGSPAASVGKVPPSVSWAASGIFKVIVEAMNTCGPQKDTTYVVVGDLAAINVTKSTNSPSNCTPTTRTYTNNSTGSATVLWTITPNIGLRYLNSTTQNSKSPSIEFTQKGTYFVKMEMVNACGNNVYLDTIVVKTDPSVSIADLAPQCSPASFSPQILTENDGGSAISRYLWRFAGATIDSFEGKTPPPISFETSGSVTLTVFNDCGSFTATKAVTVNQAVRVAVSRTTLPTTNCGPFDVTYNNVSTGGSTYNWTITPSGSGLFQLINNSSLNAKNPSIKFLKSGTYYVRLEMPSGCQSGIYLDTIVVKTDPSVSIADLAPQCSPASFSPQILLENDGGSAILRYLWRFTGARIDSFEGKTLSPIPFDTSGSVTLTVFNGCGSFTTTKAITVNQAVRVDVSRSALPPNNCGLFEVTYPNASTGSDNFKWSVAVPTNGAFLFTNATTNASKTPTIKFLKSGTYIVKLLMENGCKNGNYEDTINVFTKPDIRLQSVTGDCIPVSINPKATVLNDGGRPLSTAWILDGGTPNAATNLDAGTVIYAVGGVFKQIFKATNLCGETTDSTEITARDRATVVFAPAMPTKVCTVDAPFVVNVSPLNIGVLTGTGLTNETTFDPSIAPRGANVLTYKVGVGRCQDSGKITINVFGTTVDAGRDTAVCGAVATDFPLLSGTPDSGIWTGTGVVNGRFSPTVAGIGRFVLTYSYRENVHNCVNSATKTVNVNALPDVKFTLPTHGCQDIALTFPNQTTGSTAQTWYFGDGRSSTLSDATHTYAQAGNYTIKLIAATGALCRDSLSKNITISKPPIAAFSTPYTEGCTPLSVLPKNTAIDAATTYKWTSTNGQNSILAQPDTFIYKNLGFDDTIFTLKLEATTQGCPSVFQTKNITVFPKPTADFSVTADTICSNERTIYTQQSKGGANNFLWNLGNGVTFRGPTPPSQLYVADTSIQQYKITLNVENRCGKDSISRTVTVIPTKIKAFFNLSTLRGCAPLTVDLTNFATRIATVTYKISNGDDLLGGDTTVLRYTFLRAGTYKITQYATRGCGYDSTFQFVTVLETPSVFFDFQEVDKCNPSSIRFQNNSPDSLNGFAWKKDGVVFSTASKSPIYRFEAAGVYTITLTAKSPINGCFASDSAQINVRAPLKLAVDSLVPSLCADSTGAIIVQLNKIIGGQSPFTFSLNDTFFRNTTGIFSSLVGQKNYTVRIRDANGCRDSVRVFLGGLPPFAVALSTDKILRLGDSVLIKATSNRPNIRYKWSPTEWVNCDTCETVWLRPFRETVFTVVATDKAGCEAKARIKIGINGGGAVYMPNVITKNRDGINDVLFPQTDVSVRRILSFEVYDRWGSRVFSRVNFEPNQAILGWDGGIMQPAVFIYLLKIEYLDGRQEVIKGDVTLVQ